MGPSGITPTPVRCAEYHTLSTGLRNSHEKYQVIEATKRIDRHMDSCPICTAWMEYHRQRMEEQDEKPGNTKE